MRTKFWNWMDRTPRDQRAGLIYAVMLVLVVVCWVLSVVLG